MLKILALWFIWSVPVSLIVAPFLASHSDER